MRYLITIATALLAGVLIGCGQEPQSEAPNTPVRTAVELAPYQCGDIKTLHTLGDLFFGSQPNATDLEHAKDGGIETVVNLRHPKELKDLDEAARVKELGMTYVNIPFKGPDELTDDVFSRVRETLRTAKRPLLLHCSSSNRVGAVWIPYRVLDDGASIEAALDEARKMGLRSKAYEARAREYVARQRQ